MKIQLLDSKWENEYEQFVKSFDNSLFYHSLLFRNFIKAFFGYEDRYLMAFSKQQIVGVLPSFIQKTSIGSCLNSLPFFGSNGGLLTIPELETASKHELIQAFYELAEENHCLTSTMISSPFDENADICESFQPDFHDKRIGQITQLPQHTDKVESELLYSFSAFTRRMIRKALKNEVTVQKQSDEHAMEFIKSSHELNMQNIGGKVKPKQFFDHVLGHFQSSKDYEIWMAYHNKKPVASLLLFYYNQTVEYYVPTIVKEYRSLQPLSLIIFRAMIDAVKQGYTKWNWGGTWPEQEGVYHFKRKWNAVNIPYEHYVKVHDKKILSYDPETIQKAFPYFYVIPFNQLSSN